MLTIFNGRRRDPSHTSPAIFIQADVQLREHLHRFWNGKNANALSVFLALALHMDADGWCWPSTKTLKDQTGISDSHTITNALRHLIGAELDGKPMLTVYRRLEDGKFRGNVYHIFPGEGGEAPALAGRLVVWVPEPETENAAEKPDVVEPQAGEPHAVDPHLVNKNQNLNQNHVNAADAAPMKPIQVTVPDGSRSRRAAYTERCTECGDPAGLTQTLDWCKTCGRPVVWHNSPDADKRAKDAKHTAADAKAKARQEQESYLSPFTAQVLALARAESVSEKGGTAIHYNQETKEEHRLNQYQRALGSAVVTDLLHRAKAEAKGRGMIVVLLRMCEAYVPPGTTLSTRRPGQMPNPYETVYD